MAEKYSVIQQHQPLRVPSSWGKQEKAFVMQLEEVLDDIYRRFGRLRLEDLSRVFRDRLLDDEGNITELIVDYGQIQIDVRNKYDKVNGITIDEDGILVTGTKYVKIMSGGSFDVDSTNFKINSSSGYMESGNWTFDNKGVSYYASTDGTPFKIGKWSERTQYESGIYYNFPSDTAQPVVNFIAGGNKNGVNHEARIRFTSTPQSGNIAAHGAFFPYGTIILGGKGYPIYDSVGTKDIRGQFTGGDTAAGDTFRLFPASYGGGMDEDPSDPSYYWYGCIEFNRSTSQGPNGDRLLKIRSGGNGYNLILEGNVTGNVTGNLTGNIYNSGGMVNVYPRGANGKYIQLQEYTYNNVTYTKIWGSGTMIFEGSLTGAASLNVLKAGDTMTGHLKIQGAGERYVSVQNTNTSCIVYMDSDSANHGIYSSGYWNGTSYTANGKWLIYRGSNGTVTVNGNCTGSSGSCTGNAATATRINGNLGAISSATNCNIWVSSTSNADGIPKYVSGVYVTASTGVITAKGFSGPLTGNVTGDCSGSAGSVAWENVTGKPSTYPPSSHTHSYLPLAGGVCTNHVYLQKAGEIYLETQNTSTGMRTLIDTSNPKGGIWTNGYWNGSSFVSSSCWIIYRTSDGYVHSDTRLYGAVWNDYAECRETENVEPGRCVTETESGVMRKTTKRLQAGCKVVSDTYGMCMGETKDAKTPIAVSGRVLVYPYRDRKEYHLGDAVCSAPNGTVDVMTREEIKEYPERIIGTVSEIPKYNVWHGDTSENPKDVHVNGRIWIYVR